MIVVGGVIPPHDYPALFAAGAEAVFGPGTNIPEAAADLINKLNVKLRLRRQGRGGVVGNIGRAPPSSRRRPGSTQAPETPRHLLAVETICP